MKTPRKPQPLTVTARLDETIAPHVRTLEATTGWSHNRIIHTLMTLGVSRLEGTNTIGTQVIDSIAAARSVHALKMRHARELKELTRKKPE